jgi:hypothetical protein
MCAKKSVEFSGLKKRELKTFFATFASSQFNGFASDLSGGM